MSIGISIADDHPIVLQGLEKILSPCKEVELLDTCCNGELLLQCLRKRQPDVLLLDIQMPGQEGDELAAIITAQYPQIKILALTNLNQTFHVRNMFLKGAKGYLLKSAGQATLIKAIETVQDGRQYIDEALREEMLYEMVEMRASGIPPLTQREKEILELIAGELTSQQIAKKLFISLSTVENHRINILFKLNVKNSVGLVRKALQLGIIK